MGLSYPGSIDSAPRTAVGTIVRFRNETLGEGEFIYLSGGSGVDAGDVCSYQIDYSASVATSSVAPWVGAENVPCPLCIATAATVAATWGWYQISGSAAVNSSGTIADGDDLFWQAAGVVSATSVDGPQMLNAVAASANGVPATNKVIVTIDRPLAQGASNPQVDLAGLGIVGDGADKTALLNSIFTTYGAAAYYLRNVSGAVLTTGTVNMPNGGVLTMADDAVWEANLIKWLGSTGTVKDFTAPAAEGDITFSFDTSGIVANDWVYIFGCTNLGSADALSNQLTWSADLSPTLAVYPGQFLRARSLTSTVMTALGGARWPYAITPGPASAPRTISQAWKVDFATGGIRGGTLKAWLGGSGTTLVNMLWARGVFIEGVRFDMTALELKQCVNMQKSLLCRARNCSVSRTIDGGSSTLRNSFNVQSCEGIDLSYNTVIGGNQNFDISVMVDATTSPSFDCSITNNAIYSAFEGATSHPGSVDVRIDYNRIIDCQNGIRARTPRSSANFNTIINAYTGGFGILFQQGWFDGITANGNIIEGFVQGMNADYRSSGVNPPSTMQWSNNVIRNATTGIKFQSDATQQNATTRAVVIRGGEISGVSGTMSIWIDPVSYCNGLTIEGVTFSGSVTFPVDGVIILPANIANVTIGTNYFRDTGAIPCIYGPGATVISDMTAFPAGEAAAKWSISTQRAIGTTTGVQTANMPTGVDSYAPGNPVLWISELGKLTGTNATACSTILGTATTVADIVDAINCLIYPEA